MGFNAFKKQWEKIKENWLIIAVVIALLLFMNIGGLRNIAYSAQGAYYGGIAEESFSSDSYSKSSNYIGLPQSDFAPEAEERKITKTASLSSEIERGDFQEAEQQLKEIISSSDSFLLNEYSNRYGTERTGYYYGSYGLKVESDKYDSIISQLKSIGKVESFSESANDVTGQYTNAEINLEVEKARLERYNALYDEAKTVSDKLDLNDRIFDQERTVKYLEDSISRLDQRVEYSTVYVSLTEEQSGYADIVLVKFSALIRNFVSSFNSLLALIFKASPWAVALIICFVAWKFLKKTKAYKKISN